MVDPWDEWPAQQDSNLQPWPAMAYGLEVRCSVQLNYGRLMVEELASQEGFEPSHPVLETAALPS